MDDPGQSWITQRREWHCITILYSPSVLIQWQDYSKQTTPKVRICLLRAGKSNSFLRPYQVGILCKSVENIVDKLSGFCSTSPPCNNTDSVPIWKEIDTIFISFITQGRKIDILSLSVSCTLSGEMQGKGVVLSVPSIFKTSHKLQEPCLVGVGRFNGISYLVCGIT